MKKIILTLTAAMFTFFAVNAQTATTTAPAPKDDPNAAEITFENLVHDYGTLQKGADGNCGLGSSLSHGLN